MQVFSVNHTDKDSSGQHALLARFSVRTASLSDGGDSERYIAFLTPDEIETNNKDLQFPENAVRECTNHAVQAPKIEMLDDLIHGFLNLLSETETGLSADEIGFFLSPAGLVLVSRPSELIDSLKQYVLTERTAKHAPQILPERLLFNLLEKIISSDIALMRGIDEAESKIEEKLLAGEKLDYPVIIFRMRQKTLHLMQYMGLMVDLSDILEENDNKVIPDEALRLFQLISTRLDRLERASVTLRESVMQLREAYQSQVDIDANLMMRLFTVVSTVFLPLTVLTGWYGMNFKNMPELSWKLGYPLVFLAAVFITIGTIWYCKIKKYL